MIKTLIVVITIIIFIYFIVAYVGLVREPTVGISGKIYQPIKSYIDIPVRWIDNFIEERRDAFEKEIEREKKEIEEGVRDVGTSLWNRMGDYIFRR